MSDRQTFAPIALILALIFGYGVYWNISHMGAAREAAVEAAQGAQGAQVAPYSRVERAQNGAPAPARPIAPPATPLRQRGVLQDPGVLPEPRVLRERLADPNAPALDL